MRRFIILVAELDADWFRDLLVGKGFSFDESVETVEEALEKGIPSGGEKQHD